MIKKKKPERVWTDKGSEFKGEFKKFCEKKEIQLYTTEIETKRNIRKHYSQIPGGKLDLF